MNDNYTAIRNKTWFCILIVLIAMLSASQSVEAQVTVPFTQRTSQYTPDKSVYNVRGDFTMIGNTNLTLQNYGDLTQNGNNMMAYTDIDAAGLTGLGGTPTFNSSAATLTFSTENSAVPACSNIIYAGLYWTGRSTNVGPSNNTFSVTKNGITKVMDKRKIQLKGPASNSYTEFTAAANDIYYPTTSHDFMYSAYTEVTDYVKANGIGSYQAADIALIEGNGGGTGYYGGWGMVVIYENSKMKHRDITLFDGHAYVVAGNASFDIPVNGFHTVQSGPVGVKLGLIAGEGDKGITGDYFRIKKNSDATYIPLSHSGNTSDNFFNSSIQTGGNTRNPNLVNNSGLDISMFNIPNPDNSVLGNNQSATNFRYGSGGDTYIIFVMAMAVDAYIPDFEGALSAVTINGSPPTAPLQTIQPGQDLAYKVNIYNKGTEAINNAKVTIPVPYNATYLNNSAVATATISPLPTPNNVYYDPMLGFNGSIVWEYGTLPVPSLPETILGELTFTFRVTENCTYLKNTGCNNVVSVNGQLSGTGAITGITFDNTPLIQGYVTSGTCQGVAIPAPLRVTINAANFVNDNCPGIPPLPAFVFCDSAQSIPISEISSGFEPGTLFFSHYPIVSGNTIQYTVNNPFPASEGNSNYFAVSPGNNGCYFEFTIMVGDIVTMPVAASNVAYCQGAPAQPLTATATNPNYTLFYYTSPSSTPQLSLTPSTAVAGTTTYYVAESQSGTCIGPLKSITVTINPTPTVTAPASFAHEGCGVAQLPGLAYSSNAVPITLAQYQAAGGVAVNPQTITAISYSDTVSGTCPIVIVRTFTIANSCGNPMIVQQNITLNDNTPPVINPLPQTASMACSDSWSFAQATATDNCSEDITLTYSDMNIPGSCASSYSATRTWTATDACGNTSTASQTIVFSDTANPSITVVSQNIVVACNEVDAVLQWLSNHGGAQATDNCSMLTWSNNYIPVSNTPGQVQVIFSATDLCGNATSYSATITYEEGIAIPEFDTIEPFCIGSTVPALATTSNNGITGSWSPSVISNTASATYTFTPDHGQCAASTSMEIIVNGKLTPTFDQIAPICENGIAAVLTDISLEGIPGTWSPPIVNNTQTSNYVFTPLEGHCATQTSMTVLVTPTIPLPVTAYAACNTDIGLSLDLNDSLPDGTPSGGLWIDVEDTNALNGSTFTPNDLGVGFYNFRYEVTNQDCPYIVELTVEVDDDCGVLPCGNIVIHNAFSPNNDGTNDYFSIENIDDLVCYPSNTLQVYNRWQVLVFETDNYDNKTRCFKGISEGRVTIDRNSELPTGTYFYILQYTTSEGNVIKKDGYIYLSR